MASWCGEMVAMGQNSCQVVTNWNQALKNNSLTRGEKSGIPKKGGSQKEGDALREHSTPQGVIPSSPSKRGATPRLAERRYLASPLSLL